MLTITPCSKIHLFMKAVIETLKMGKDSDVSLRHSIDQSPLPLNTLTQSWSATLSQSFAGWSLIKDQAAGH